jgi:hypothetical protein
MIVKPHPKGWEIIYQRSHGLLAAQIGYYFEKKQRPARWFETLVAITEHDDAQEDFTGKNYITEAGSPMGFQMKEYVLAQHIKITEYARRKSRWTGLMISMHMSFLYEEKRGKHKDLDAFLDREKEQQEILRKSLGISKKEAQAGYELVEWCDALSLLLCRDLVQPEERKTDISTGPDGTMYQLWQRTSDGSLEVEPWCFEEKSFTVGVEVRIVEQLQFKDDKELEKVLHQTPPTEKTWTFRK